MELKLIRNLNTKNEKDKNAIESVMIICGEETHCIRVLENLLYLAPEGTFIMKWEFSPKFNTFLWELYGTNKRTEIKCHEGIYSQHSKGCILFGIDDLNYLHDTLDNRKTYKIEIIN